MNVGPWAIAVAALAHLSLAPPLAHAQTPPTERDVRVGAERAPAGAATAYRKLHALVIGINRYASPGIPPLAYAENDAREVAGVLRELYGFDTVTLLLGANATRDRIVEALASLQDRSIVTPDDGVVIYFSGHGQTVPTAGGEQGYLLPVDARVNLSDVHNAAPFRRYAIRMDDLRSDADAIPARHILFLVDACYSGYLSSKALDETPPEMVSALRYPARQVITAGTKGERAVEHHAWGHGAFTYKLLERLRIETDPVSATSLGTWLKRSVPREVAARAPQHSLTPQAKYLSGDGDFYFIRTGYAIDAAKLQRAREPVAAAPSPEYYRRVFEAERILNELEREAGARR